MKRFVLALLRVYRYAISPMLGRNCRFVPSCSEYAVEAVERHGALKHQRVMVLSQEGMDRGEGPVVVVQG